MELDDLVGAFLAGVEGVVVALKNDDVSGLRVAVVFVVQALATVFASHVGISSFGVQSLMAVR